jgi:diacylglycerol kinase (ATP)
LVDSAAASPWLAILNPRARRGAAERLARPHLAALRDRGVAIDVRVTTQPREAMRVARDGFAAGYRRFLAIGGDGTAFEVLNGFLPAALDQGADAGLAVLPAGTGNSFARHFATGGREDPSSIVAAIAGNVPRRCDILRLQHAAGEHFALGTVAVGFPPQVSALVNGRLKRFGVLGYTLGVLVELLRLRPYESDLTFAANGDRRSVRGRLLFAAIQNVVWVGGNMKMAPGARTDDGLADLVVADAASRLRVLRLFPKIFDGRHVAAPEVHVHRCDRVTFHSPDRRPVMLDGEVLELAPRLLEVLPGVIPVWAGDPPVWANPPG